MVARTALFLKTKHLGDSIVLTSAISAMPEDFLIDVLCFSESAAIFSMNPRVRNVFIVARHLHGFARLVHDLRMLRTMRKHSYDVLAQFSDDWRGAFLTRIIKPVLSVAREARKRPKLWANSFQYIAKRTASPRPAAEQDVDLLRKIHLFNQPIAPEYQLVVSETAKLAVERWLDSVLDSFGGKKLVLIHAAARWKFKGLPNATWANLIKILISEGYEVVLTGAPSDLANNQQIVALCDRPPLVVGNFDLSMTAALMQKANLLISIDSMSIHMASALQTPVVAIFGPTDSRIWAPWRVQHRLVALSADTFPSFSCRPCGLDGCAGSKISQCLVAISEHHVMNAMNELLSGNNVVDARRINLSSVTKSV